MTNSLFPNIGGGGGGGEGTEVCYRDVYRDVSERREIGRTFKLTNTKHKDPASVHMTLSLSLSVCLSLSLSLSVSVSVSVSVSLSLNLLVCWAKVCKQCAYF